MSSNFKYHITNLEKIAKNKLDYTLKMRDTYLGIVMDKFPKAFFRNLFWHNIILIGVLPFLDKLGKKTKSHDS